MYSAFELARASEEGSPTPRELKRFVNDVVTLYRLSVDPIPLHHIAYYACRRRALQNVQTALLTGEFVTASAASMFGRYLQSNMAALWFGTSATLAEELLLKGPLLSRLREGDVEGLVQLAEVHSERLWVVLGSATRDGVGVEQKQIGHAARCLLDTRVTPWQRHPEYLRAVSRLNQEALDLPRWDAAHEGAGPLRDLLALVNDRRTTKAMLSKIVWSADGLAAHEDGARSFIASESVDLLSSLLREPGLEDIGVISTGQQTEAWLATCDSIRNSTNDRRIYRSIRPSASWRDIQKAIIDKITSGTPATCPSAIVVSSAAGRLDYDAIHDAIQARLAPTDAVSQNEFLLLVESFDAICEVRQDADAETRKFAESSSLLHWLAFFRNALPVRDICLAEFMIASQTLEEPPAIGQSAAGYSAFRKAMANSDSEQAEAIVKRLNIRGALRVLLRAIDGRGQAEPLVEACLRLLAEPTPDFAVLTGETILKYWEALESALDDGFVPFLDRALVETSLTELLLGTELVPARALVLVRTKQVSQAVLEVASQSLSHISRERWLSEVLDVGPALRLAVALEERGCEPQVRMDFCDALIDFADRLSTGAVEWQREEWSAEFLEAVLQCAGTQRQRIRRDLLKIAKKVAGQSSDLFLDVWGRELMQAVIVDDEKEDLLVDLFDPVLRENNPRWRHWLAELFATAPRLLEDLPQEGQLQDFHRRLHEKLELATEEELLDLRRIAEVVGVE
ncbi:MAG: hypothetical protein U0Q11_24135 [Vicinamibacterales bacterium]